MARSTYIYVVTGSEREVLAAFTVRHELVSWLGRDSAPRDFQVFRVPDGRFAVPARITAEFSQ